MGQEHPQLIQRLKGSSLLQVYFVWSLWLEKLLVFISLYKYICEHHYQVALKNQEDILQTVWL